jgi:glutamine synthetase
MTETQVRQMPPTQLGAPDFEHGHREKLAHAEGLCPSDPRKCVPTRAPWGYDDRSSACRVITTPQTSAQVEQRRGGADAPRYISAAAVAADGIYEIEAVGFFETSPIVEDVFPRRFIEAFTATRRTELLLYEAGLPEDITDFELERHLEQR